MRIATLTVCLWAVGSSVQAGGSALECLVIRSHIETMQSASRDADLASLEKAQAVKDAINSVLVDPRMPAELVDAARQKIFGKAFDDWEATLKIRGSDGRFPEDKTFDALMADKCEGTSL